MKDFYAYMPSRGRFGPWHPAAMQQRLEAEEKAARLLPENPQLLRLKELDVLREIGMKGGNPFYIGLEKLIERGPVRAATRAAR